MSVENLKVIDFASIDKNGYAMLKIKSQEQSLKRHNNENKRSNIKGLSLF